MRRNGFTLVDVMVALLVAVLVLNTVWRIFTSLMTQDTVTRLMADRLQTFAIAQRQLARDLEPRCNNVMPQIGAEGRTLTIPGYAAPTGPADGPRGGAAIEWRVDETMGVILRNGKVVGFPVVEKAWFVLDQQSTAAALRLTVKWSAPASVPGAPVTWSRVAHAWQLAEPRS